MVCKANECHVTRGGAPPCWHPMDWTYQATRPLPASPPLQYVLQPRCAARQFPLLRPTTEPLGTSWFLSFRRTARRPLTTDTPIGAAMLGNTRDSVICHNVGEVASDATTRREDAALPLAAEGWRNSAPSP